MALGQQCDARSTVQYMHIFTVYVFTAPTAFCSLSDSCKHSAWLHLTDLHSCSSWIPVCVFRRNQTLFTSELPPELEDRHIQCRHTLRMTCGMYGGLLPTLQKAQRDHDRLFSAREHTICFFFFSIKKGLDRSGPQSLVSLWTSNVQDIFICFKFQAL